MLSDEASALPCVYGHWVALCAYVSNAPGCGVAFAGWRPSVHKASVVSFQVVSHLRIMIGIVGFDLHDFYYSHVPSPNPCAPLFPRPQKSIPQDTNDADPTESRRNLVAVLILRRLSRGPQH